MLKSRIDYKKIIFFLLMVILTGFISQVFLNNFFSPALDPETDLMNLDAQLVIEGKKPFQDFLSREPFWLSIHTAKLKVLGPDLINHTKYLFYGINISLVFILLLMWVSPTYALLGALLFALNPLGYYLNDDQTFIALYFIAISSWLKKKTPLKSVLMGALIGFAINYYRGSFPFLLGLSAVIGVRNRNLKELAYDFGGFAAGAFLTYVLPLGYLILSNPLPFWEAFDWMDKSLMAKKLLAGYVVSPFICLGSYQFSKMMKNDPGLKKAIPYLAFPLVIMGVLAAFKIPMPGHEMGATTNSDNKIAILHEYFRIYSFILVPFIFSIAFFVINSPLFKKKRLLNFLFLSGFLALIYTCVFKGNQFMPRAEFLKLEGTSLKGFMGLQVLNLIGLCYFSYRLYMDREKMEIKPGLLRKFMLFLLFYLPMLLLAIYYPNWMIRYMRNHYIYMILMVLIMAYALRKNVIVRNVLVSLIVLNLCFNLFWRHKEVKNNRFYVDVTAKQVETVKQFLAEDDFSNKKIFTANQIIAFRCGFRLTPYITHPMVYVEEGKDAPAEVDPFKIFPTIPEIIQILDRENVSAIVVDYRTRSLFFKRHPAIEKYVRAYYDLVKIIPNDIDPSKTYAEIHIFKKKPVYNVTKSFQLPEKTSMDHRYPVYEPGIEVLHYDTELQDDQFITSVYWRPLSEIRFKAKSMHQFCHVYMVNDQRLSLDQGFPNYFPPSSSGNIYKSVFPFQIDAKSYEQLDNEYCKISFGLFKPGPKRIKLREGTPKADFVRTLQGTAWNPLRKPMRLALDEFNVVWKGYQFKPDGQRVLFTVDLEGSYKNVMEILPVLQLADRSYIALPGALRISIDGHVYHAKWDEYFQNETGVFSLTYALPDYVENADIPVNIGFFSKAQSQQFTAAPYFREKLWLQGGDVETIDFSLAPETLKANEFFMKMLGATSDIHIELNQKASSVKMLTKNLRPGYNELQVKNSGTQPVPVKVELWRQNTRPLGSYPFYPLQKANQQRYNTYPAANDSSFHGKRYQPLYFEDQQIRILGYNWSQITPENEKLTLYYQYLKPTRDYYQLKMGNESYILPFFNAVDPFALSTVAQLDINHLSALALQIPGQEDAIKIGNLNIEALSNEFFRAQVSDLSKINKKNIPLDLNKSKVSGFTTQSQPIHFGGAVRISDTKVTPKGKRSWSLSFSCALPVTDPENLPDPSLYTFEMCVGNTIDKFWKIRSGSPRYSQSMSSETEMQYFFQLDFELPEDLNGPGFIALKVKDKLKGFTFMPDNQIIQGEYAYISDLFSADFQELAYGIFVSSAYQKNQPLSYSYQMAFYADQPVPEDMDISLVLSTDLADQYYSISHKQLKQWMKDKKLSLVDIPFDPFKELTAVNKKAQFLLRSYSPAFNKTRSVKLFSLDSSRYHNHFTRVSNPLIRGYIDTPKSMQILFKPEAIGSNWKLSNESFAYGFTLENTREKGNIEPAYALTIEKNILFYELINQDMSLEPVDFSSNAALKIKKLITLPSFEKQQLLADNSYILETSKFSVPLNTFELKQCSYQQWLSQSNSMQTLLYQEGQAPAIDVQRKIRYSFDKLPDENVREDLWMCHSPKLGDVFMQQTGDNEFFCFITSYDDDRNEIIEYISLIDQTISQNSGHNANIYQNGALVCSMQKINFHEDSVEELDPQKIQVPGYFYSAWPIDGRQVFFFENIEDYQKGLCSDSELEAMRELEGPPLFPGIGFEKWTLSTPHKSLLPFDVMGEKCYQISLHPHVGAGDHIQNDQIVLSDNVDFPIEMNSFFYYCIRANKPSNLRCSVQITLENPENGQTRKTWSEHLFDNMGLSGNWNTNLNPYYVDQWLYRSISLGKFKGWNVKDIHLTVNDYPDQVTEDELKIYVDGLFLGNQKEQRFELPRQIYPYSHLKEKYCLKINNEWFSYSEIQSYGQEVSVESIYREQLGELADGALYLEIGADQEPFASFYMDEDVLKLVNSFNKEEIITLVKALQAKDWTEPGKLFFQDKEYQIYSTTAGQPVTVSFTAEMQKNKLIENQILCQVDNARLKAFFDPAYLSQTEGNILSYNSEKSVFSLNTELKEGVNIVGQALRQEESIELESSGAAPGIARWQLYTCPAGAIQALDPITDDSCYQLHIVPNPDDSDHFSNDLPVIKANANIPIYDDTALSYFIRMENDNSQMHFSVQVQLITKDGEKIDTAFTNVYDHNGRSSFFATDLNMEYSRKWHFRKFNLGKYAGGTITKVYFMANDEPALIDFSPLNCYADGISIYRMSEQFEQVVTLELNGYVPQPEPAETVTDESDVPEESVIETMVEDAEETFIDEETAEPVDGDVEEVIEEEIAEIVEEETEALKEEIIDNIE